MNEIGHDEVDRTADVVRPEVTDVAAFSYVDPRIVPNGRVELAVPDVDGHDLRRAPLEEAVGEATCGGAGVEGPAAGDVDREVAQGGVQLLSTPADEARRRA